MHGAMSRRSGNSVGGPHNSVANTDKMAAYGYRSESSSDESLSDLESIEGYRFQPKQQGPILQVAPKGQRGEENLREAEMARRRMTSGDEVDWCHC